MDYNDIILEAQVLENNGELEKAWDIYIQIVSSDQFKEKHGEAYFQFALFLFRSRCYDEGFQMFIKAYELKYNQRELLEIIDKAYYIPNIKELRTLYHKNCQTLKLLYPDINIIPFKDLSLKFFPVSDVKFYIFDRKNECFIGSFSLNPLETKTTYPENESVMIKNIYDFNVIDEYTQRNTIVYLIYDPIEELFQYLQVIKLEKIINHDKVKLFFTLVDFVDYSYKSEDCLIDKVVNVEQDDEYYQFIKYKRFMSSGTNRDIFVPPIILEENKTADRFLKELPWGVGKDKVLLSFCIPTYGRGQQALENVQHILNLKYYDEIEVVVCDNNSTDEDGKYRELSQLNDSRLRYYKHSENIGFARNVLTVIQRARGKYVYILSDEDYVNLDAVPKLLKLLGKAKKAAVFKGSMQPKEQGTPPINCIQFDKDYVFKQGYDALMGSAFDFNYISGTIYNRDLIIENGIYKPVVNSIAEHYIYPHLYLSALLCTAGTYNLLADVICLEGKAITSYGANDDVFLHGAFSFENRLAQHALFIKVIHEVLDIMNCNDSVKKANLYLKLCNKTAHLIIRADGPYYLELGRDISILAKEAYYNCLQSAVDLFQNITIKNQVKEHIKLIFKNHMNELCEMLERNNIQGVSLHI